MVLAPKYDVLLTWAWLLLLCWLVYEIFEYMNILASVE
jgi:hypothetical protein